jgi:hypothetical protein
MVVVNLGNGKLGLEIRRDYATDVVFLSSRFSKEVCLVEQNTERGPVVKP